MNNNENRLNHVIMYNIIPQIQIVQWKNGICTTWCDFLRYFTQIHDFAMQREIYMLFTGWEVRIEKYFVEVSKTARGRRQPRTQALSTTRLAGGKTLVQAGHVSPRFWEITNFLHNGGGLSLFYRSSCRYQFDKVQSVCILTNACIILTNGKSLCCKINGWDVFVYVFFVDCICDVATQDLYARLYVLESFSFILGKPQRINRTGFVIYSRTSKEHLPSSQQRRVYCKLP
jgi:hypothetical protein